MEQNNKFKLFSNCIPVKGAKRSTICDLQRNDVRIIPNDLADILLQHDGKSISEIKKIYANKYDSIIDEYFEFLLENEFIFFTSSPSLFPKIKLKWDDPSIINNAILDRDRNSDYNIIDVINQLSSMNCRHIELRFFDKIDTDYIINVVKHIEDIKSSIISIDIILPNDESLKKLNRLIKDYKRIASFRVFNSSKDEFIPPLNKSMGYIIYTKKKIENNLCCGIISKDFFVANTLLFTESINFNSCLNRKIGIDVNGDIKNCPSMKNIFGNVKSKKLNQSISEKRFRKLWTIKKDEITICKDCEFRHICTDCRAFLENPKDIYSKPLKCGYNPYTNKWKDWATNPLKSKTIKHYGIN